MEPPPPVIPRNTPITSAPITPNILKVSKDIIVFEHLQIPNPLHYEHHHNPEHVKMP